MFAQYHFHIKLSMLMLPKKKEQHNDIDVELIQYHSNGCKHQLPSNKQHGIVQTSE